MLVGTFSPGFLFSSLGGNGTTKFVVNVCGHDSVGWPLARNMENISESYLDDVGLDNLIIPISVSEPRKEKKVYDFSINVVVHTCLTTRIQKSFRLSPHYIEKLTVLAIQWIKQECGIQLMEKSCSLLGIQKGYNLKKKPTEFDEIAKAAAAAATEFMEKIQEGPKQEEDCSIPKELQLSTREKEEPKNKPLIQEVVKEKGIKKGFLTEGKHTLYGPEGSKQGTGKAPDPLAHIPESLRKKCTIVDTRNMSVQPPEFQEKAQMPIEKTFQSCTIEEKHKIDDQKMVKAETPFMSDSFKEKEEWKLLEVESDGDKVFFIFDAPSEVKSIRDVDLEVTSVEINLDGLKVPTPREIDPDSVKAKFLRTKRRLIITCTVG